MECRFCGAHCNKKGIRNGNQSYRCSGCGRYQKKRYKYSAYTVSDEAVIKCVREGLGIRGMSRLLGISPGTVLTRIESIARTIEKPPIPMNKTFEVDRIIYIYRKQKEESMCGSGT